MNNVEVRGYTNDYRVLESSWISGIGSLAGKRSNEVWTIVGQCLGDGRYITTEDVRTAFSNAKVGDWIQMVRKGSSGTKQHSAIISELYDDGFEVVHSNWDAGQIINTYFSYESFAQQCRNAGYINGYNGGFTINHFGDPTPSGIPIDAEHFPDEAFRNCVHEAFDANGDWYLSDSEISNAKTMQFGGKGISDATGIKLLTSLEWVELQDNSIRVLDLSGMTKLTSLWCWNNGMTGLSVSGCSSLPELWAYDNALRVLNVSKCASLKKIYIWTNNFTGLSLSNLPSLEGVWAAGCKSMKELYVENNPAMTMLYVDKCTALEEIHAKGSSKINSLLLDDCYSLKKFERDSSVNLSAYVPKITTTSLPRGYVGENYSATVKASGIGVI
ncbi:MAG: hypothetical protein IJJ91_11215, partial [Synergistaceae bacterium]|nr:hypothetical protein [Synergistaceae bacterium]